MLEHVQCIVLIGSERRQPDRSQRTYRSSTTTVYALLPEIFTDVRPEICDFFWKNNIQVVENSTNPKDLFTNARKPCQLDIFEIKLINVDVKHEITEPTVHVAEHESSREVARLLFSKCVKGISSDWLKEETFTYCAIDDRSVRFIGACLSYGAVFGYRHYYGGTALHFAIKHNSMALLKMFLKSGYSVDTPQTSGQTPLHHAVAKGRLQMVKTLLQSGANVNIVAISYYCVPGGTTPLLLATNYNHSEIVKLLLENKANVNAEYHSFSSFSEDGRCKWQHETPLSLAAEEGHLKVVEALARVLPEIDVTHGWDNMSCSTPLMYAAKNGNLEIVNLLLEKGANVNGIQNRTPGNEDGIDERYTALHVAAEKGRVEIVKFLLDQGANVDGKLSNGSTPLLDAAEYGHIDVVILLIEAGANINAEYRNYRGKESDLLLISLRKENQELLDIVLSHRSQLSSKCITRAFYFALVSSRTFSCKNVNNICKNEFVFSDDDLQNVDTVELLFGAIHKNRQDLVEQLLSRGVNVNSHYNWSTLSITPLHLAAATNIDGKIVSVLVNHGADVNMPDCRGSSPALHAVGNNNMNALKTLIDRKVNIRGDAEALFTAVGSADFKILETLLLNGIDTRNELPGSSATAVQLAVARGDLQKLKLLLKFSSFRRNLEGHDSELLSDIPEDVSLVVIACEYKMTEIFQTLLDFFFHDDYCVNTTVCLVVNKHPDSHWSKAVGYHVAKKVSAGLRDGSEDELLQQLLGQEEVVAAYCSSCETEVEKMKSTKVGGTDVSFFDMLSQSVGRISSYLRNSSIEQEVQTSLYETQFPLYGSILKWQLEKGSHRRFLLNRGIRIFSSLFKDFSALPFDLKEKIVDYLDNEDLQMLVCI